MDCQYCPLAQEALLHISGPDTITFLQGQTTCDARNINPQQALPGIYCTPQGRVVCDFLLAQLGEEHYAMRMRRDIRDNSSAVFGKYIIFSKASLDASREDWQTFALWGQDAASTVKSLIGSAPAEQYAAVTGNGLVVIQMDTRGEQFECLVNTAVNPQPEDQFAQMSTRGAERDWQASQIAKGIARIESATVEEFVPQTLNYDLTGHISFDKGCYTGQEVVARLHYRGTPKRRMYLATLPKGSADAMAGSPVFSNSAGQSVGNIINSVTLAESDLALVAATQTSVEQDLHLGDDQGPLLVIGELPYQEQLQG